MDFQIPDCIPRYESFFGIDNIMTQYKWQKKGMYAFVSWKWVIPFSEWIGDRKVLEVMSGGGYLAYALREKGVNMIATDTRKWETRSYHKDSGCPEPWTPLLPIEKLNANKAITKYGKNCHILVISWPYMDDSAYHAIKLYHKLNPQGLVVYIGEWGGCTASHLFFEHFDEVNDVNFKSVAAHYERWPGLEDKMVLGRYKP